METDARISAQHLAQAVSHDLHSYGVPPGNPPGYFSSPHTTHAVSQMHNTNPHAVSSPSCSMAHPYSPPTHLQQAGHGFPMSPKMAASATTYPSAQASPVSCVYNSDPASPMQVTYSPAQPPATAMILSSANVYTQCNGEAMHLPPSTTTYTLSHASSLASATLLQADYLSSQPQPPISGTVGGYGDGAGYGLVSMNPNILPASMSADFPPQHLPVPVFPGNRQAANT